MRTFSPPFRLWHWLSAFSMFGIIVTVLLRKTVMHKEQIGGIVQTKLAELGTVITDEQAVMIGKAVRSPMWDWHIYFGIAIAVLLVWRVLMVLKNGFGFDENPSMKRVYMLYRAVYVLLAVMSLSGLSLYLKFAGESKELVEGIHMYIGYALFAFVAVHIAGVILAERSDQKGLVSRMISGG
ncbi:cytochrome b/b6 domain-containing protein [Sulfuricurvum sp.]|uniref:cytochrome b/b6 domain-containing protein n=1 Tax=Sulfuricurvum sp. TaxID=2025608 RepID=UPI0026093EF8|nr:cytochrome b/b6 domain-containing protein [Sulfuricurvum sp.]MDD2781886.1 cytochrome b/b6 domain-containing protein [Sulfuricurvum sp.]